MSTLNNTSNSFTSQDITIFLGIPFLVAGIIGGLFNIITFSSLKTFRQSSCAFFLTIMSFVNIGQLFTGLLSRIMITGFNIDWTQTSLFYCKFRIYCLQVCGLTSYTCMCLATIDQFLATSSNPERQQWLNMKRARRLVALFFVIWIFHGIPYLIWYELVNIHPSSNTQLCLNTNLIFQKYVTYGYLLVLVGILPISVTVLFASLAYRNVKQLAYRTVPLVRRELDKQLTIMVLLQIVYNFLIIIPYITVLIFVSASYPTQSLAPNSQLFQINVIFGITYYLYFASPFYIYVCVSKRFRQQFIYVLVGIHFKRWYHQLFAINQVQPQVEAR